MKIIMSEIIPVELPQYGHKGTEPIVCLTEVQTLQNLVSSGPLIFTVMLFAIIFSFINSIHYFVSKYLGGKV